MADSKITALASISTSTDPAVDPLVIVDVSDTSMAATGTTKKVTLNNLLSSSPTATGAFSITGLVTAGSATITGDLTVDTSTLKVDSTNNRVGVGTASPTVPLDVLGSGDGELRLRAGSDSALIFSETTANKNYKVKSSGGDLAFQYSATAYNSGYATPMILTASGNLLVGVTSTNANGGVLQLKSGITFPATQSASSDANTLDDYEEGTWVPTQGAGLTVVGTFSSSGTYTKVGRLVTIAGSVNGSTSIATAAAGFMCAGLPFASSQQNVGGAVNSATTVSAHCITNVTDFYSITAIGATTSIRFSATYQV